MPTTPEGLTCLPCFALPCLALPLPALPCLALSCLACTTGWSFGTIYPNVSGEISVRGGEVTGTQRSGVHISAKSLGSASVRFVDHRITNVATAGAAVPCNPVMRTKGECFPLLENTPIGLYARHGQSPTAQGGVSFTGCTIEVLKTHIFYAMLY